MRELLGGQPPPSAAPGNDGLPMPLNWRALLAFVHDALAVAAAWIIAFWLRFNLDLPAQ